MENWTVDNFVLVVMCILKIAYTLWPVTLVIIAGFVMACIDESKNKSLQTKHRAGHSVR